MSREARVAEIRRLLRESRNASLAEDDPGSRTVGLADSAIAQSEELLAGVRALARRPRSFAAGEDVGVSVNTTVDVGADGDASVDEVGGEHGRKENLSARDGGNSLEFAKNAQEGADSAQIQKFNEKSGLAGSEHPDGQESFESAKSHKRAELAKPAENEPPTPQDVQFADVFGTEPLQFTQSDFRVTFAGCAEELGPGSDLRTNSDTNSAPLEQNCVFDSEKPIAGASGLPRSSISSVFSEFDEICVPDDLGGRGRAPGP